MFWNLECTEPPLLVKINQICTINKRVRSYIVHMREISSCSSFCNNSTSRKYMKRMGAHNKTYCFFLVFEYILFLWLVKIKVIDTNLRLCLSFFSVTWRSFCVKRCPCLLLPIYFLYKFSKAWYIWFLRVSVQCLVQVNAPCEYELTYCEPGSRLHTIFFCVDMISFCIHDAEVCYGRRKLSTHLTVVEDLAGNLLRAVGLLPTLTVRVCSPRWRHKTWKMW